MQALAQTDVHHRRTATALGCGAPTRVHVCEDGTRWASTRAGFNATERLLPDNAGMACLGPGALYGVVAGVLMAACPNAVLLAPKRARSTDLN